MAFTFDQGRWLNPPPQYTSDARLCQATSGARTDFWRHTHYGFVRDNGHFLGFDAPAEFTAQIMIEGDFQELYDQAGLMLRVDPETWVKAGAEFTDGSLHLSTVITKGHSDWSVSRSLGTSNAFGIRMTLKSGALQVQASGDGRQWELIRLAPFQAAPSMQVGPMFCTPERAGLKVTFKELQIGPPLAHDLHTQD